MAAIWLIFLLLSLTKASASSQWILVYRLCTEVSTPEPIDAYLNSSIGTLEPLSVTDACTETKKSYIINTWEEQNVEMVRVSVYVGKSEMAYITFDGKCSETTNWFASDKIIASSYRDIKKLSKDITVLYDLDDKLMFNVVYQNKSACEDSLGWLTVVTDQASCPRWQTGPFPAIYFSNTTTVARFGDSNQMIKADWVGVWVKLRSAKGQRKDLAENLELFVGEETCSIEGISIASGFAVNEYDENFCTMLNCSGSPSWIYLDLGFETTVGAININPVASGSKKALTGGNASTQGNYVTSTWDLGATLTVHSVAFSDSVFLEPFVIRIGDLDEDEAIPVCYYEKDVVNLEGQKYICGTPLTGTQLHITQYNQTDSTNLTQITNIDVYYIPDLELHVTKTLPVAVSDMTDDTLCGLYPNDLIMSTIYCNLSQAGQYVVVLTKQEPSLAFCDIQVHEASLLWRHSIFDACLDRSNPAVDIAQNASLIPNPDRPLDADGVVVGWDFTTDLQNYQTSGETATIYLQLWRNQPDAADTTSLRLVGQTEASVSTSGSMSISLDGADRMDARRGDLLGMTMPGFGSLVYYKNNSDLRCVLINEDRISSHQVGELGNFTSVWLDDWTYDLTAILAPYSQDKSWVTLYSDPDYCLSSDLEFVPCKNYTENIDIADGVRWKLDSGGQLINMGTFGCLDISPYHTEYLLVMADCYNVSWGLWQFSGNKLKNVIVDQCLTHDRQCRDNGISNAYLDVCTVATDLLIKPLYLHATESRGCYYATNETFPTSTSAPTRIPDTDTLGKCSDWCADSYNVSMFSMLSETCTCHNDSYQSYITLPENYCDWPCYEEEPFEKIPTCGARPRLHRSFYVTADVCLFKPNIWKTDMLECVINGIPRGDVCPVYCAEGYNFSSLMSSVSSAADAYLAGYVNLTCLSNGNWELREEQICEPVTCPLYNDSSITPTRYTNNYTQWEIFECRPGYKALSGNVSINVTCTANGTWDQERLLCTIVKCPVLNLPAGVKLIDNFTNTAVIDLEPNNTSIPYNSWQQYTCTFGYKNLSDVPEILTCQMDGTWSTAIPDCELIDCQEPPPVANANATYSGTYYLDSVTYTCNYGYEHKAGNTFRYCGYDGAWNNTAPTCTVIQCSSPPSYENTTMTISDEGFNIGSVVKYRCAYGYKSADSSRNESQNECRISRQWESITPPLQCILIECSTPPNINFTLVNQTGNKLGDSAVYTPKVGYQISIGIVMVTCRADGKWVTPQGEELTEQTANTLATVEVITCGDPPFILNTDVTGTGNVYNDERVYTCNNSLPGTATSRCNLKGLWTPVSLVCEVTCPAPTQNISLGPGVVFKSVDPDTEYLVKSTLSVICDTGYYYVSGSGMYTCSEQGTWIDSGDGPRVCNEVQCKVPSSQDGMECTPPAGEVRVNTSVQCQCVTNMTMYLSGNMTRTCQVTGKLSGYPLRCQAISCPSVHDVGVLKVLPQGYTPGEKCVFLCTGDYAMHPDDPTEMECLGTGEWSLDTDRYPRCVDPYEPIYPEYSTDNGTSKNSTVPWMVIKVGEDPNIIGTNTSGVTRLPFYGGCNPPQILQNAFGTVYNDSGRFSVIYKCMEGYNMSTTEAPEMKCSLRQWIGPAFECLPFVFCPLPDTGMYSTLKAGESELFSPGSEIQYSCEDGYFAANGDPKRVCGIDGAWSGEALNCKELPCPEPPTVKYASYEVDKYSLGKYCTYKCFPGYKHVSGDLYKNCSSLGIWIGDNPVCEVSTDPDESSLEYIEALIRSNMSETMIVLEKFGFTEADFTPTSQSIGSLEVIFLVFVVVFFIGADIPDLKREFKHRLVPNLKSCFRK